MLHIVVLTPQLLLTVVWPLPLSLATTRRISFDFSSSGYLDVSVPRVPLINLLIQLMIHDSSSWAFPHSDIRGSRLICSSPRLFAAYHVLHRLPMPRHSPYALLRLNYLQYILWIYLVLVISLELLCFILAVWRLFSLLRLAKLFYIFTLTEKPDFVCRYLVSAFVLSCFFPLLLSVMYSTLILL